MSFTNFTGGAWRGHPTTAKCANTLVTGDSIAFTSVPSGATAYTVRNYDGTVVASGSLSSQTTLTLGTVGVAPFDKFGWYRLYMTGPSSDANFSNSYAATNFVCAPASAHFPTDASPNWSDGQSDFDQRYHAATLAANPARWSITDIIDTSIAVGGFSLSTIQAGVAADDAYWSSSTYTESARPREKVVEVPSGGVDRWVWTSDGPRVNGFVDYINRADSTTSVGTPDAGSYTVVSGTWGISGNALYSPTLASPSMLYFNTPNTSQTGFQSFSPNICFDVRWVQLGGAGNGVLFRGIDSTHYYLATETGLQWWSNGTPTTVASWTQLSAGDVMRVSAGADGGQFLIVIYINGTRVAGLFDTHYTGTMQNAGLLATSSTAKWAGFSNGLSYAQGGVALSFYPKVPNTTNVGIGVSPATTSGFKITVYSPDRSTVAETYDNLATNIAAETVINAASTRIRVFTEAGQVIPAKTGNVIMLSNQRYQAMKTFVTTLYPSIKYFEGPINEPFGSQTPSWTGAQTAHAMMLFQASVHAGNASALATGPGNVNIVDLSWYDSFGVAGGYAYCDSLSYHFYNGMDTDIATGRRNLDAFQAKLVQYGAGSKPKWQTENGSAILPNFGVFHPRRSRWWILELLMQEQIGCPRERNYCFGDTSHGDWNFPAFLYSQSGPMPSAAMQRTLVDETFNRPFVSRYNFGVPGDQLYIANLYTKADGTSVVVMMAGSPQLVGQITWTLSGTIPANMQIVDAWGNVSTAAVSGNRVTVPVQDSPAYLRLPAGTSATLYSFADWPPVAASSVGNHLAVRGGSTAHTASGSAQFQPSLSDGAWTSGADGSAQPYYDYNNMPSWVIIDLGRSQFIDRVTVWSGEWRSWTWAGLADFDIQTSPDKTTWTTQRTITRSLVPSIGHGDDAQGTACPRESFDPEMWIFDAKLPSKVQARYVRIWVRSASYGCEVDPAAQAASNQGGTFQNMTIQEVGVYCDDTAIPRYATKT